MGKAHANCVTDAAFLQEGNTAKRTLSPPTTAVTACSSALLAS
jgi:hypothetical protein